MSSAGFARCPAFEPGRSPRFAAALVVASVAAVLAILVAQLPLALKLAGATLVAACAWHAVGTHGSRTRPGAVVRVAQRGDGHWVLQRRDGRTVTGALHDDSFVHPLLVIIGVQDGPRATFVPVPADALPPADHRRLRVLVKWQPTTSDRSGPTAATAPRKSRRTDLFPGASATGMSPSQRTGMYSQRPREKLSEAGRSGVNR